MLRFMSPYIPLAAALALAPLTFAQLSTGPIDLGTLGGTYSAGSAISSGDTVAGTSTTSGDAAYQAFTYVSGSGLTDLGSFAGPAGNSYANAIDATAAAVAGSSDFNDPVNGLVTHGFFYNGGTMTDVGTLCPAAGDPTPCGTSAVANGVQYYAPGNAFLVVGSSEIPGDTGQHAFLWNSLTGSLTDLGTLGGAQSFAYAVNTSGQVVGNSGSATGTTANPTYWDTTKPTITPKFLGSLGGHYGVALAVNNSNVVAGFSSLKGDTKTQGFVWQLINPKSYSSKLNMTKIPTLGGTSAQANAVNNASPFAVVGSSNTKGDADVHAFIWTSAGGTVDLNSQLPAGSGWDLQSANAIGDDGTIIGVGIIGGQAHAFQWNLSLP